jgi:uncharacterized phage infection (PIP) family protein YhgE
MPPYFISLIPMVLGPVVGFIVYKWQIKEQTKAASDQADIQTRTMAAQAGIQAAQSPIAVLTAAVTARDAEMAEMRKSHEQFMQGLVAQFQATTNRLTDTLNGIRESCQVHCATLRDVQSALAKHSEESAKGRGVIHARLNALQLQVAGVRIAPEVQVEPAP